ncbi:MAG: serine/threonine-protein kinase [Myxococcota bacterium]
MRRTLLDETPADNVGRGHATGTPDREATQDLGPSWDGDLNSDALANTDGDVDLGEAAMRARLAQKMFGDEVAEAPPTIGRFVVSRRLGSGGMGSVYEAHDPELERRVALKLLHPDLSLEHQIRLRREAQALARVTHENVVRVYEVGMHEERMFVAMELIAGQPLRDWQANAALSWQALVSAYVQAGRGLAAAHAQDLIHRDFKPANAMMGDDGIVRVLDFGLARIVNAPETLESPQDPTPLAPTLLEARITVTGTTLGTPVYMSPEQMLGQPLTAASDQYSFCISLYEALYKTLPYEATTSAELADKMLNGDLEPPASSNVPRRVFTILARGLASQPDNRHPSMEALCQALGAAVRPPRRWLGIAALTLALGGSAAAMSAGDTPAPPPGLCDDDAPRIEARVSSLSLPKADHRRDWLDAWDAEHARSCAREDTEQRACLFTLLEGDAAGQAPLTDCSTAQARASADARQTVADVRRALWSDDVAGATAALDALEARFSDTAPPRLLGEFALLRGQIAFVWEQADEAEAAYERAAKLGIQHDMPALLVDAWLGQADLQARLFQRLELAQKFIDDADTMLERVATPLDRAGWLALLRAKLATDAASTADAIPEMAMQYLTSASAVQVSDPRLAERIASARVEAHRENGEYERAIEMARDVVVQARERTRPASPSVLRARSHLADVLLAAGEHGQATVLLRELLVAYEGTPLEGSRIHIGTLIDLGNALKHAKKLDEAAEALDTALEVVERVRHGGMQHIRTLVHRGDLSRKRSDFPQALAAFDAAMALSARYDMTPPGDGLPIVHVETALRTDRPEHAKAIAAKYGDRLLEDGITLQLLEIRNAKSPQRYEAICAAIGADIEQVRTHVTAAKARRRKP